MGTARGIFHFDSQFRIVSYRLPQRRNFAFPRGSPADVIDSRGLVRHRVPSISLVTSPRIPTIGFQCREHAVSTSLRRISLEIYDGRGFRAVRFHDIGWLATVKPSPIYSNNIERFAKNVESNRIEWRALDICVVVVGSRSLGTVVTLSAVARND